MSVLGAEAYDFDPDLDPTLEDEEPIEDEDEEPIEDEDEEPIEDEDEENQPWFLRSPDSVAASLLDKKDEFFNALRGTGLVRQWRVNWSYYYGTDPDNPTEFSSQNIKRVGPEKEFTRVRINEFRSFVKQQIQTALGPRPAYKATTKSTDFATLAGIEAIDRGIAHVMLKTMPENKRRRLLERAVVFGMSFGHMRWDKDGGDDSKEERPMKGEDGQPIVGQMGIPITEEVDVKTGIPVVDIGGPWQMFFDAEEEEELPWVCVIERRSKWDLAAQFPELADEIKALADDDDDSTRERTFATPMFAKMSTREDVVTLHHFYLTRSAAAPDGRYIGFVKGVPHLWDAPLPVQAQGKLPVVPVVPSAYIGAFLGYADAGDLISIQQLIDSVVSDWASNVRAFGRLNLLVPKGTSPNLEALRSGLKAIDYNGAGGEPKYLVPPSMDQGVDLTNYLHRRMESVSQQNAVRRGDPQANIKSGTMAALFNQISIEFQSDLQQSFDSAEQELANIALELLQARSRGEFIIKVAGQGFRPYWEAFRAEGFKGVQAIHVETISPQMRSPAGRYEAYNIIKNEPPDKKGAVLRGLDTGDWSGVMDENTASDMRLVREREVLLKGEYLAVNVIDKHEEHLPDHYATWEQLEAADPTIAEVDEMGQPVLDEMTGQPKHKPGKFEKAKRAVLDHIQRHRQAWQYIDPGTAMLLGRMLPPPILGTPTGDMAMLTGGQAAPPPPGTPTGDQAAQGGGAGAPPPEPGGDAPPQEPGGEQPQQPEPAEPAEAPQ